MIKKTHPKPNSGSDKKNVPKISKRLIATALISFGLGAVVFWGGSQILSRTPIGKSQLDTSLLFKVESILRQKYNGDIDYQKQSEGAAAGAVAALGDPYTVFLDKESNKELSNDLKGELSGIGVEVGQKNNRLTIIAPFDGTPADAAGLRSGDIIIGINDEDTANLAVDQAVSKIRGEAGTKVKLTILRGNEPPKDFEITRELINIPSVTSEMKDNNIGYIKIRRFGEDTSEQVKIAGNNLKAQGAKVIVLDVRDNPGGYLQSSVEVASEFYSDGVVVEERSRNSKPKIDSALPGGTLTKLPVIVLINGGSASASEILAGALNDNDRATLVGEKTYGKGSVQEVICLNSLFLSSDCDGPSLKVTVANWFTPAGINISKEGIKPEVEVKLTSEDANAGRDPQLQKALELAKQALN
jgi:carboxyl-terminal processing protease